jgi:hypothetical protein
MKPFRLLAVLAVAALLSAALAPGCGRTDGIPDPKESFIAQYTWTLSDYATRLDDLTTRAETMPSPFREDAMYRIERANDGVNEAMAMLDELKAAPPDRTGELMVKLTETLTRVAALYDEAEAAVKEVGK